MNLPLGRKLPLLISGLLILVVVASSGAAYLEVERTATSSAEQRVTGLATQLAGLVARGVIDRGALLHRVASDSAVKRLVRSPASGKLDVSATVARALERLIVPNDSAGIIEVWDQSGHPRARYGDGMLTVQDSTEDGRRQMLVAYEAEPRALDSVRTGPFYVRGDSIFAWHVQPILYAGLTTAYVAQRVRLSNDASAQTTQRGLRELMGPGVDLYLANTTNDLRTTTTGDVSVQPAALKTARRPVMYHDSTTGEMLGAKAAVPMTPWVVEIAMPRRVVLASPLAFLKRMSVFALFTLIVGALLAWLISREVTRPLAELTAATHDLSTGEYGRRVLIARGDELGQLGDAFNLMAERISETRAVSEQQRVEAEAARREALDASEAKSDFLAVMSHELRTPLNAILGFSSLMLDGITGPMTVQQQTQLERIRSGGQHLLSLIEEILSLSRLEAGQEDVRIESGDAFAIARETAALAEPIASLKRLPLVTHIPSDACECRTDVTKLRQILLNLLSNAIKFTNTGAVTLAVRAVDNEIFFSVSDTGIGIPTEHRARIFDPFYQVEMSKAHRVAGTGLGLSVTRHLALLLGGDVELAVSEGVGSVFEVRIPRHVVRRADATAYGGTAEHSVARSLTPTGQQSNVARSLESVE